RADHAVLVLAGGTGVAQLCRREGALTAPATCTVADLLAVLAATPARHVTVLAEPSATRAAETAAAQARDTGHDVVVVVAASAVQVLAAGGELVTVLLGQDAPEGFAEVLTEQLRAAHPKVETMCYAGDVPQRVLLVGVE